MKNLLTIALIIFMCLSVTACASKNKTTSSEEISENDISTEKKETTMQTGETVLIPDGYYREAEEQGNVVKIEYDTYNYCLSDFAMGRQRL